MTWETFYVICFVIGLAFSLLSFLGGASKIHLPAKLHLPHGALHHGPAHVPAGHLGTAVQTALGGRGSASVRSSDVSFFNLSTLMVFLAWFGGTGYLLMRYSNVWALLGLGIAALSGLGGASIVFSFLVKVLLRHETKLDPADYELIGTLGTVNSPIREGGTGEIIFSQAGTRCTSGARSDDGSEITKGSEVVITRYERGIAYVKRWDDLTK
jgi:membrane protein implicated in regulation of membrane protease activity